MIRIHAYARRRTAMPRGIIRNLVNCYSLFLRYVSQRHHSLIYSVPSFEDTTRQVIPYTRRDCCHARPARELMIQWVSSGPPQQAKFIEVLRTAYQRPNSSVENHCNSQGTGIRELSILENQVQPL